MTITTESHFPCPSCGAPAHVRLDWLEDRDRIHSRFDIADYICPHRCQVDEQTLRQIVGTSGDT